MVLSQVLVMQQHQPKAVFRSSPPLVFSEIGVLKIFSKFTGEPLYRSVISIKLQSNFIEITLWHGCSPVNLLNLFRIPFSKNTDRGLLLDFIIKSAVLAILSTWYRIKILSHPDCKIFEHSITSLYCQ